MHASGDALVQVSPRTERREDVLISITTDRQAENTEFDARKRIKGLHIIAQTIASWDPDATVSRIELAVGRDLRSITSIQQRFLEEARITAQLQHPGIPPIHEIGQLADGSPYLVMKLIKGRTLADLLKERPNQFVNRLGTHWGQKKVISRMDAVG